MFRVGIDKLSLRKKLTILALVGVLLPLLALTYLQYRSLTELQNKTKGAFKDNLRQGLTLVEVRMRQRLEAFAAQTGLSDESKVEKFFPDLKQSHPEIDTIFAYQKGTLNYADLNSGKFERITQAEFTPKQTHLLFLFDKARMAQSFLDADRKYLFLYDASPISGMRPGAYLFFPQQNGFGGFLLKESFVSDVLIGGTIRPLVASHSPTMAATLTDENQRVLYSNGPPQNGYLLESNLALPFSNWKAAIGLKDTNIDALARDSFLHSAGASVLVLVVLLCGIALTLRAADREARLAQAKSNFVANVSHELKTPLSLLSLFSEILELGRVKDEEKKTEYYRIIRDESRRLNKMIDNILDFSKIEAGRKTYNFVHSDMAEVIDKVLASYRYQIANSGFELETTLQPDLPPVLIDRDAMAQAISNLVDNAIKYSRDVKQLSIATERRGTNLSIEIADRGIGIPRAEQAKVFEKFYRVGNGLVHDVKGSGLGLSLVKHIVEAHHGTIALESDDGKGTRFTILLPLS